jgi:bacterioferritin
MHKYDHIAKETTIRCYNESINVAAEVENNNTNVLLESILKEDEEHIDWIEVQLDQIKQMGFENYLEEQIY